MVKEKVFCRECKNNNKNRQINTPYCSSPNKCVRTFKKPIITYDPVLGKQEQKEAYANCWEVNSECDCKYFELFVPSITKIKPMGKLEEKSVPKKSFLQKLGLI